MQGQGDDRLIWRIWRFVAGPPWDVLVRLAFGAAIRVGVLLQVVVLSVAAVHAEGPPPAAVVADVPFLESPDPSTIVIDLAKEEGARPFPLVLDTGASFSTLTPRLARELGVRVRST